MAALVRANGLHEREEQTMRILAVDDDPVMLDLLGAALEDSGFDDITFAASAEDALELIDVASTPYDVFLLDVMLPEINGIEVCRHLRSLTRYRAAPVIMITASRARTMMARAFEAGATDFVSKPIDPLELVTRIKLAAMLSDAQRREQMSAQAVEEMSQLTDLSFDAWFDLHPSMGCTGFLALENDLLRGAETLHEVALFTVQIDNALGVFRGSTPGQFRASIESVARALNAAVDDGQTRFAYAGRGAMFCVTQAHNQFDAGQLQEKTNSVLSAEWDSFATNQPTPLTLAVTRISGPPAWSGKAVADLMHSFQGSADLRKPAKPYEVDGLFSRLSVLISPSSGAA